MHFEVLEEALLTKGVFLEITALDVSWAAALVGPRGKILVTTIVHHEMLNVLAGIEHTLGGVRRRGTSLRGRETTALKILIGLEVTIDIRRTGTRAYAVKFWAPQERIPETALAFTDVNLWFALNEAIATIFATISAKTIGH